MADLKYYDVILKPVVTGANEEKLGADISQRFGVGKAL